MLRGLDDWRRGAGDGRTIIKAAGRSPVAADVTVYADRAVSGEAADRRDALLEEVRRLEAAGVLEDPAVCAWQDTDAAARYGAFRAAVGAEALSPFFETRAGGDALSVPPVCIALHEAGDLVGLYPKRKGDAAQTPEDCLRAMAAGDRVENVR